MTQTAFFALHWGLVTKIVEITTGSGPVATGQADPMTASGTVAPAAASAIVVSATARGRVKSRTASGRASSTAKGSGGNG